ncbi:beta strand repeat-containing protein, partial [Bathymodiolus thermophilus thioautotrophic gill symbiont]
SILGNNVTIGGTDNRTLTVNPSKELESNKSYYIEITAGTLTDVAGNDFAGINNATDWTFSAASLSTTVVWSGTDVDATDSYINANELAATTITGKITNQSNASDVSIAEIKFISGNGGAQHIVGDALKNAISIDTDGNWTLVNDASWTSALDSDKAYIVQVTLSGTLSGNAMNGLGQTSSVTIDNTITGTLAGTHTVTISNDAGILDNDRITNDSAVKVSLTLENALTLANDETLQVSADGTNWVATTNTDTNTNTAWATADDAVTLATGANTLTARVIDTAGNVTVLALSDNDYTLDTVGSSATLNTTVTTKNTGNISVQSSETGTAYLVHSSITVNANTTQANLDAFALADKVNKVTIATVDTATDLAATGLVDGEYKVYTVDIAGNISTASTGTVTIDTTAPTAPTALNLITANDTGSSDSDNITNKTTLTIEGTIQTGTTSVELFSGSTSLGTVIVAMGATSFSKEITLTATAHAITAKASDTAGNVSLASSALAITVDTATPTVSTVVISATDSSDTAKTSTLVAGDKIVVTATMSEAILVTGMPTYTINIGGDNKVATYVSGSSSGNTLVFTYTVATGDTTDATTGITATTNALLLNSGTIKDIADNAATVTTPAESTNTIIVDAKAPTLVEGAEASGSLFGKTITITEDGGYKDFNVNFTVTNAKEATFSVTGTDANKVTISDSTVSYNGTAVGVIVKAITPDFSEISGLTIDGNTLTKTGANGWNDDGNGFSATGISNDGFVSAQAGEIDAHSYRMFGLSANNDIVSYEGIDYAIYIVIDSIHIYENGSKKGDYGSFTTDDVFSVQRIGDTISYLKNGVQFYESLNKTTDTLYFDTAFYTVGSSITNVKMGYDDIGDLEITFNADATQDAVNAVTNAVTYTGSAQTVTLSVTDEQGLSNTTSNLTVDTPDTLAPTLNALTAPTVTIDANGGNSIGDTIVLTITFDGNVNGLTSGVNSTVFTVAGTGVSATWSGTNDTATRTLTYTVASGQNGQAAINETALKAALVASIKDAADNAFTYTVNDGSIANIDGIALPVIDAILPTITLTTTGQIASSSDLVATFSEAIVKGTGDIVIKESSDGTVFETLSILGNNITIGGVDNRTLTINPSADLEPNKSYYIEIATGVLTDVAGNNFAGINNATDWTFSAASLSTTVVWSGIDVDATDSYINANELAAATITGKITNQSNASDVSIAEIKFISGNGGAQHIVGDALKNAISIDIDGNWTLVNDASWTSALDSDKAYIVQVTLSGTLLGNAMSGLSQASIVTIDDTITGTLAGTHTVTISNDAGILDNDRITNDSAVKVSLTLENALTLANDETLQVSADGTNWVATTNTDTNTNTAWATADDAVTLVTGANTLTARVIDTAGNITALALSNNGYILNIIKPTVTAVAITASKNLLIIGDTVTVTLTTDKVIYVTKGNDDGNTPQYEIMIGNVTRQAIYKSGSGSTSLVFEYTVMPGDNDTTGGITASANKLTANGTSTLEDIAGNNINPNAVAAASVNTLIVDAIAPIPTITMSDTALATGETATVTFAFNKVIKVEQAIVSIVNTTNLNTWSNTGKASDVVIAGFDSFVNLNGNVYNDSHNIIKSTTLANTWIIGDVTGGTARYLVLTLTDKSGGGIEYQENFIYKTNVSENDIALLATASSNFSGWTNGDNYYKLVGLNVSTFDISNITSSNGTITNLTVDSAHQVYTATFTPEANIEDTTNVITVDANWTDTVGNAPTDNASSENYRIDNVITSAPAGPHTVTISNDTGILEDDRVTNNNLVKVSLTLANALILATDEILQVSANGTTWVTTTNINTNTNTAWETADDAVTLVTGVITTLTARVTDTAGNVTTLALNDNSYTLDIVKPTVTAVTITANSNLLVIGDTVTITLTTDEIINVTKGDDANTPKYEIMIGDVARQAVYKSGSGSTSLVFKYTIIPGEADATGGITSNMNKLTVNGTSTLKDAAGNNIDLNVVAASVNTLVVNAIAPVSTITINDTELMAGETTTVTFTFDKAVKAEQAIDSIINTSGLRTWSNTGKASDVVIAGFDSFVNLNGNVYDDSHNIIKSTTLANTWIIGDMTGGTARYLVLTLTDKEGGGIEYQEKFIYKTGAIENDIVLLATASSFSGWTSGDSYYKLIGLNVSTFDIADITAPNGTITNLTVDSTHKVYTSTFTPAANTEDTTNVITINTNWTDTIGNIPAGITSSNNYFIDSKKPNAPIGLSLADEDNTGSNSDNITSQTNGLSISGTTEEDVTVELFNGSLSLGTKNTDEDGNFTIDINLSAGSVHNITAIATDIAGNVSDISTTLAITVDTSMPTIILKTIGGISPDSNLMATFDEGIAKGTGNIVIKESVSGVVFETLDILSNNITISGANNQTLVINPSTDLEYDKSYYIEIPSGALTDLAGNIFAGINNVSNWTFNIVNLSTTVAWSGNNVNATDGYINANELSAAVITGTVGNLSNVSEVSVLEIKFFSINGGAKHIVSSALVNAINVDANGHWTLANDNSWTSVLDSDKEYIVEVKLSGTFSGNIVSSLSRSSGVIIDNTIVSTLAGTHTVAISDDAGILDNDRITNNSVVKVSLTLANELILATDEILQVSADGVTWVRAENTDSTHTAWATANGAVTLVTEADTTLTARVIDMSGNIVALTLSDNSYIVDTTNPTVTAVTITAKNNFLKRNDAVTVTLTTDKIVNVTKGDDANTPQYEIMIGDVARQAIYKSGSGSTSLVFEYIVTLGETDTTEGITASANKLTANGTSTLKDIAGNNLDFDAVAAASVNTLTVDAVAPVPTITMSDTALITGETTTVTFTFSKAVSVEKNIGNMTMSTLSHWSDDGKANNVVITGLDSFKNSSSGSPYGTDDVIKSTAIANTWIIGAVDSILARYLVVSLFDKASGDGVDYIANSIFSRASDGAAHLSRISSLASTSNFTNAGWGSGNTYYTVSGIGSKILGTDIFDESDITSPNGTITDLTANASNTVYTATFTPTEDITDSSNMIHIGTDWTDSIGNAATGPTKSSNYTIDTLIPVIESVTLSATDSNSIVKTSALSVNDYIVVTIAINKDVIVTLPVSTSTITYAINVNGQNKIATYTGTNDSNSLIFKYQIEGNFEVEGDVEAFDDQIVLVNGATIKDASEQVLNLNTKAIVSNARYILLKQDNFTNPQQVYIGEVEVWVDDINVALGKTVTVGGGVIPWLNWPANAIVDGVSTTGMKSQNTAETQNGWVKIDLGQEYDIDSIRVESAVDTYDNTNNLVVLTSRNDIGGDLTIDQLKNDVNIAYIGKTSNMTSANRENNFSTSGGITNPVHVTIDTKDPTIDSVIINGKKRGDGQLFTGSGVTTDPNFVFNETKSILRVSDEIIVKVTMSEVVHLTTTDASNPATYTIKIDGVDKVATYVSGSDSNTLIFSYAVEDNINTTNITSPINALSLGADTLKDAIGNNTDLTISAPNITVTDITIDNTPPVISAEATKILDSAGSIKVKSSENGAAYLVQYEISTFVSPGSILTYKQKLDQVVTQTDPNGIPYGVKIDVLADTFADLSISQLKTGERYKLLFLDESGNFAGSEVNDLLIIIGGNTLSHDIGNINYGLSEYQNDAEVSNFIGGTGADTITGNADIDTIAGGAGADMITGGAGADIFNYNVVADSTKDNADTITDFEVAIDKLNLKDIITTGTNGNITDAASLAKYIYAEADADVDTNVKLYIKSDGVSTGTVSDSDADMLINLTVVDATAQSALVAALVDSNLGEYILS